MIRVGSRGREISLEDFPLMVHYLSQSYITNLNSLRISPSFQGEFKQDFLDHISLALLLLSKHYCLGRCDMLVYFWTGSVGIFKSCC